MIHHDVCRAGCSVNPTREELTHNHGTPAEFARAVRNAIGEISVHEAETAIRRYKREWRRSLGRGWRMTTLRVDTASRQE